jgi:hypothetical protein
VQGGRAEAKQKMQGGRAEVFFGMKGGRAKKSKMAEQNNARWWSRS